MDFFAVIPLSFFKVSKIVKLVPFMIVFSWIFGFLLYFTSLSTKFINFISQYTASITNREVLVDRVGGIYVQRFWQIFLFWIAITMFVLMVTKIVSLGIELQKNLKNFESTFAVFYCGFVSYSFGDNTMGLHSNYA
ncbi:hypothetical protein ACI3RH_00860 [Lactococcus lactis]